jgi:hypothetical protein
MEPYGRWFKFSIIGKRLYLYGYRPAEMGVRLLAEVPDPSFRVTAIRPDFYLDKRQPTRVSLGCHIIGVACPSPDLNHGPSQLAGMVKRVATQMPPIDPQTFIRFTRFVKRFVPKYMSSLVFESDETFEVDEWLSESPYTIQRRKELQEVWEKCKHRDPSVLVKAFIKNEDYEDPKHVRGIYSRSDEYKCFVGPFMKKFGNRLFDLKWFIKKIPVSDRPKVLLELQKYDKIFCTDFSQYEATFVQKLMSVMLWVFNYSLSRHPLKKHYNDLILKTSKTNHIHFKNFSCKLQAKRMSGEMDTSCSNGCMNLLFTFFILQECGNKIDDIMGFFEGDDGIMGCRYLPTAAAYTALGCNIKIDIPDNLSEASFCGNVFDPDDLCNVTNPLEASVRFGWTSSEYMNATDHKLMQLLRCKSYSMLYEYPACPILRELALYGLRITENYKISENFVFQQEKNSYEREKLLDAFKNKMFDLTKYKDLEIPFKTRLLVQKLYKISIVKQLAVEKYLSGLNILTPLDIDLNFPRSWFSNYSDYTVEMDRYSPIVAYVKHGYTTRYFLTPTFTMISHH